MITNAKKRRSVFSDKQEIFNHYKGRGAFKNWPEDSLKSYINGGVLTHKNQIHLSCEPDWEAKTFAVVSANNSPPKRQSWPIITDGLSYFSFNH